MLANYEKHIRAQVRRTSNTIFFLIFVSVIPLTLIGAIVFELVTHPVWLSVSVMGMITIMASIYAISETRMKKLADESILLAMMLDEVRSAQPSAIPNAFGHQARQLRALFDAQEINRRAVNLHGEKFDGKLTDSLQREKTKFWELHAKATGFGIELPQTIDDVAKLCVE